MQEQKNNSKSLTDEEVNELVNKAGQEGARLALAAIGLHDENAGTDIQDLRALIRSYRAVKTTVWKKLIDRLITLGIGALLTYLAARCGFDVTGRQ